MRNIRGRVEVRPILRALATLLALARATSVGAFREDTIRQKSCA